METHLTADQIAAEAWESLTAGNLTNPLNVEANENLGKHIIKSAIEKYAQSLLDKLPASPVSRAAHASEVIDEIDERRTEMKTGKAIKPAHASEQGFKCATFDKSEITPEIQAKMDANRKLAREDKIQQALNILDNQLVFDERSLLCDVHKLLTDALSQRPTPATPYNIKIVALAKAYCDAHREDYETMSSSDSMDVDADFILLFQAINGIPIPATVKEHELKCDPEPFDAIRCGEKTHEIRYDDRGFKVGDTLLLRRTEHTGYEMRRLKYPLIYTGETLRRTITHILQHNEGMKVGYVILSLAATPSSEGEWTVEYDSRNGWHWKLFTGSASFWFDNETTAKDLADAHNATLQPRDK